MIFLPSDLVESGSDQMHECFEQAEVVSWGMYEPAGYIADSWSEHNYNCEKEVAEDIN